MLSLPSKKDDRGESLVELLVALTVMATAIVALLGALATAIKISEVHRHQTEAGVFVKAFAETLEAKVSEAQANYVPCGTGADLVGAYKGYYPKPVGYKPELKARFWDNAAKQFVDTCPAGGDFGVQLISLTIESESTPKVTETLDVTLRKPCRSGDPACS